MKTRNWFGAVFGAVVVVMGLATLSGCGNETAVGHEMDRSMDTWRDEVEPRRNAATQAVLDVLVKDHQVGQIELQPGTKPQDYVQYIVASMKQIDVSECPHEFQDAYDVHIDAWQRVLRAAIDHANDVPTMQEWNRIATLHGTEPRTDLERELFAAFDDVHSTFDVCTGLARDYGIKQSEFDSE